MRTATDDGNEIEGEWVLVRQAKALTVTRAAVTTVRVPDGDGQEVSLPTVAAWADLDPMVAAGVFLGPDENRFNLVHVTAAQVEGGHPATMRLTVTDPTTSQTLDHGTDPAPEFTLVMPTSLIALGLALSSTPLDLRVVLVHGPAPEAPESYLLGLDEIGVVVALDPAVLVEPLQQVMSSTWSTPFPGAITAEDETVPDPMRDLLWAMVSGIALGQETALNRLIAFAGWADGQVTEATQGTAESSSAAGRLAALAAACEHLSLCAEIGPVALDGNLPVLPAAMAGLADRIHGEVSGPLMAACAEGADYETLVAAQGWGDTLPALGVVAAAAAHSAITSGALGQGRLTPSFVLGTWLDKDGDEPWWAVRAALGLLLHHDTAVLTDMLAARPVDEDGDEAITLTTSRFLHVLVEALTAAGDPDEVLAAVAAHEVRPRNLNDVLHVARTLLERAREAAEGGLCAGCDAAEHLVRTTVDQDRLAAAVTALFPVLADLAAETSGLPVGDHEWVVHRSGYLAHWLQHAAGAAG